jgi:ribosomal protein S18 acetylase RimI-like enzyme
MIAFETVTSEEARIAAQSLFREYGEFLRGTGSCGYFEHGGFDHAKFGEEIATLPTAFADHGGNVLLATVDGVAAACIAYRANPADGPATCEIKRLYVRPAFRSKGLARKLVSEVLKCVIERGYQRAILDTDVVNMPGAIDLYQSFGFTVSGPQRGSIAFLAKSLV